MRQVGMQFVHWNGVTQRILSYTKVDSAKQESERASDNPEAVTIGQPLTPHLCLNALPVAATAMRQQSWRFLLCT